MAINVPSYTGEQCGIVYNLFIQLCTDRNMVQLPFSLGSLGTIFAEMHLIFKHPTKFEEFVQLARTCDYILVEMRRL